MNAEPKSSHRYGLKWLRRNLRKGVVADVDMLATRTADVSCEKRDNQLTQRGGCPALPEDKEASDES